MSRWSALVFHWEVIGLYEQYDLNMVHDQLWYTTVSWYEFDIWFTWSSMSRYSSFTTGINIIWLRERGGTRGGGSVVAYGYATYFAMYYTYLALFSLLMLANQRNMFIIFTWYATHLIKEGWFFVSFVMLKNRSYLPSITQVMLER